MVLPDFQARITMRLMTMGGYKVLDIGFNNCVSRL